MEKFEKLNEFVEGRLHGSEEREFLGALVADDELRSEMKNLLAVNTTIRTNRKLFDVPNNSKAAIFGAVGISSGEAQLISSAKSFWNKFANGTMLVGATVATVLLLLWGLHEDLGFTRRSNLEDLMGDNTALQNAYNSQNNKLAAILGENTRLKKQCDDLTAQLADLQDAEKEIVYKTIYIDRLAEHVDEISNIEQGFSRSDLYLSQVEPISDMNKVSLQSISERKSIGLPHYQSFSWNEQTDRSETDSKALSIELNKYEFIDIDNVNVPVGSEQLFNSIGLVLGYRLSDNLKLNAEIRRESFDLAFDGYDDLGQYQQFSSIANFNTYTLGAEYQFSTDTRFFPGVDVSIGGNKVGVVPRMGASLNYELSNNFYLSLRGELSTMYFEFNGSGFFSNKAGISYGIEYIIK